MTSAKELLRWIDSCLDDVYFDRENSQYSYDAAKLHIRQLRTILIGKQPSQNIHSHTPHIPVTSVKAPNPENYPEDYPKNRCGKCGYLRPTFCICDPKNASK